MKKAIISSLLFALLFTSLKLSAAQLEELVVTAQKRQESVQDVPISITAFSGEELTNRGLSSIQNIARFIPNFDMPAGNSLRNSSLRIRGIGSSSLNPGTESSVGVFLDGIFMPTSGQAFGELVDIQSLEVLRGPQGTLYGRNTPVGALNVTTRRPTQEFESLIRLTAGNFDKVGVNGYIGGGLSDNVAGRLSFWYTDRGGYQDNLLTGDDVNDHSEIGFRGKLLLTPSDNVEISLIAAVSDIERTCCIGEQIDPTGPLGIATPGFLAAQEAAGFAFRNFDDSDHIVDGDDVGDDQSDTFNLSAQIDWELANGTVITSLTGYQDWETGALISADSLRNPVFELRQNQANEILSQEFRIVSPTGGSFDYVAGLYYYNQETVYLENGPWNNGLGANRVFPLPPAFSAFCPPPCTIQPGDEAVTNSDLETESFAAYANFTFHLSEVWDVTAGIRFSNDDKDAFIAHTNPAGNSFVFDNILFPETIPGNVSREEDNVTWSLNTRYHITDDVLLFATTSTGFKSGGFNARRVAPGADFEFENEDSFTVEAGIKSTWFDRRLLVNATVFDTTLEDFQESIIAPSGAGNITTNAGEQVVRGVESDFSFAASENFTINGSIAYLDAEYTDFDNAQCGIGRMPDNANGSCNNTGETPGFSPEFQWTLGAQWVQSYGSDYELRFRADYSWTDEQNLSRGTLDVPANIDSVGLLNLQAIIARQSGSWELKAFVNNATDESYFIQAVRQPIGAAISGGGFAGADGVLGWYGAPRVWGLQLTVRP